MAASASPCSQCLHVSGTTCSPVSRGARVLTTVSSQSKEASFVPSLALSSICSPKLAGFPPSSSSSFSSSSSSCCSREILSRAFLSFPTLEFRRRHLLRFPDSIKGAFPQRTSIDIDSPLSYGLTAASWTRSSPLQCSAIEGGSDSQVEGQAESMEGVSTTVQEHQHQHQEESAMESVVTVAATGWHSEEEKERRMQQDEEERERSHKKTGVVIRRRPPRGTTAHMVGPFEFRIGDGKPINILEEIVWTKGDEVDKMKERFPLVTLRKGLSNAHQARDFIGTLRERLQETGLPALIAEVKKASPSRGVLRENFDPVEIAQSYEKGGAACLSVLTDSKYFQGSFENLKLIRDSGVQCPLLCKEFIVDAYQIFFARLKGADAILLIAAVLPDQDLEYYIKIAKSLGMASLVEVHTEEEMDRVLALSGVELIGINNRDLGTFVVDIKNTANLLSGERGQKIKEKGLLVVGESGLFTPDDIHFVQDAGVGAVLVGESLVKQSDPAAAITVLYGRDISRVV